MKWVYAEDEDKVKRVSNDFVIGKTPTGLNVHRNYRKDGTIIWCEWYNSSIYDSKALISLRYLKNQVKMEVRDDGVGFDTQTVAIQSTLRGNQHAGTGLSYWGRIKDRIETRNGNQSDRKENLVDFNKIQSLKP